MNKAIRFSPSSRMKLADMIDHLSSNSPLIFDFNLGDLFYMNKNK